MHLSRIFAWSVPLFLFACFSFGSEFDGVDVIKGPVSTDTLSPAQIEEGKAYWAPVLQAKNEYVARFEAIRLEGGRVGKYAGDLNDCLDKALRAGKIRPSGWEAWWLATLIENLLGDQTHAKKYLKLAMKYAPQAEKTEIIRLVKNLKIANSYFPAGDLASIGHR
jgi:hypothetical protein